LPIYTFEFGILIKLLEKVRERNDLKNKGMASSLIAANAGKEKSPLLVKASVDSLLSDLLL